MEQVERMDNRRFEVAKQQATAAAKNSQLSILVGGSVAVCGFALVGFLSSNGNGVVAGTVGGFLATIIAVVVGRKLSD